MRVAGPQAEAVGSGGGAAEGSAADGGAAKQGADEATAESAEPRAEAATGSSVAPLLKSAWAGVRRGWLRLSDSLSRLAAELRNAVFSIASEPSGPIGLLRGPPNRPRDAALDLSEQRRLAMEQLKREKTLVQCEDQNDLKALFRKKSALADAGAGAGAIAAAKSQPPTAEQPPSTATMDAKAYLRDLAAVPSSTGGSTPKRAAPQPLPALPPHPAPVGGGFAVSPPRQMFEQARAEAKAAAQLRRAAAASQGTQ